MASQNMLAGMKFSITGTQNSHGMQHNKIASEFQHLTNILNYMYNIFFAFIKVKEGTRVLPVISPNFE